MPDSFFEHRVDRYDGVTIKLRERDLDMEPREFESCLDNDLSTWRREGKAGVWISIPIDAAHLVPACAALGFDFHHADKPIGTVFADPRAGEGKVNAVTMALWLKDGDCHLPAPA